MLIVYGIYHFLAKRTAFRNDYCLSCAQPRRSVQIRTFDVVHIFWIPLLPLGFHRRWRCATCAHSPHVHPGTRRGFKWAGLVVLLILSACFWLFPLTPDTLIVGWIFRIGGTIGAVLTFAHLMQTPADQSLKEKLAAIPPASDTVCPFCGSALVKLSSQCSCPACGVARV